MYVPREPPLQKWCEHLQAKPILTGEVALPSITSGKVKGHPGSHLSNILSRVKILLSMSYSDNNLFLICSPPC